MKFVDLIKRASKSNTVQINSILLAVWTALLSTDFVQSNPDILAIMAGIQSVVNILLRFKTSKPISER